METTQISKPLRTTYLGVPARVWIVGSQGVGRRVVVTRWLENADDANGVREVGDTKLALITGDRQKGNFELHKEITMTNPTMSQAIDEARWMLKISD